MSKINTKRFGIIHASAYCNTCGWTDGINIDEPNRMQKLRNRIHKHVRNTGHSVDLETGSSTTYSKGDSDE